MKLPPGAKLAPVIAIIAVNIWPLVGVLWLDWGLGAVMLLAWAENVAVGFWTLVKLLMARQWFLAPFFIVHYGGFMAVHLAFVLFLFVANPMGFGNAIDRVAETTQQVLVPAVALVLSHGVSFISHFIQAEVRPAPQEIMMSPYKRMVALHVTIIFAGFATMLLGAPIIALVFLVLLKAVIDVVAHVREHRNEGLSSGAASTA